MFFVKLSFKNKKITDNKKIIKNKLINIFTESYKKILTLFKFLLFRKIVISFRAKTSMLSRLNKPIKAKQVNPKL